MHPQTDPMTNTVDVTLFSGRILADGGMTLLLENLAGERLAIRKTGLQGVNSP